MGASDGSWHRAATTNIGKDGQIALSDCRQTCEVLHWKWGRLQRPASSHGERSLYQAGFGMIAMMTHSSPPYAEVTQVQDINDGHMTAAATFAPQSMPQRSQYDIAIVGAGIVGLATARELLLRKPGLRLIIVEKDTTIASQQSGHNSGVSAHGHLLRPGIAQGAGMRRGASSHAAFLRGEWHRLRTVRQTHRRAR